MKNVNCGGCHAKFEPWAFGLEKFDGLGSYHERDEHGNKLRDDGEILFPGQEKPASYQTSAELMNLLRDSNRVRECITWKLTQSALGRPLVAEDAPWWHKYNPKKKNQQLRAHAHMKMRELAFFLKLLDGPESIEANGNSILENSLITISTESGDGRHNDFKRELSGVFHAISSAHGRFKTGQILDLNAEGIDGYNTILNAMGAQHRLGPAGRQSTAIDSIRA